MSFSCTSPAMIYDKNEIFPVQGFRIGCFILDSLLTSSLECFYNSSCLHTFLKYININSTSIFFLSSNKFNHTDTIEILLNSLMIEQWKISIDYRSYFLACQVKSCSYTYQSRRSFLSIFTTILGLIGGLTTILVFLIPILVQLKRRKKKQTKTILNRKIRIRRMFNRQNLIKQIRLINLFKSPDSHTENDIRNEFLSTRLYIILLVIIFSLLVEYYSLITNSILVTISFPRLNTIESLNETSLICPCSITAIPFEIFVNIQPIYHPVCSSDLVDDRWINKTNYNRNLQIRFNLLALFCRLTRDILKSQLDQFSKKYFLTSQLISEKEFQSQINIFITQTIDKARSIIITSLELVSNSTRVNKLISADEIFQPDGARLTYINTVVG